MVRRRDDRTPALPRAAVPEHSGRDEPVTTAAVGRHHRIVAGKGAPEPASKGNPTTADLRTVRPLGQVPAAEPEDV